MQHTSQRNIATALLSKHGIVRLAELRAAGVTAATISRMERAGDVMRLSRGLYQLTDAEISAEHSYAEAAKYTPNGIICLETALVFHGLTDQLPSKVWLAIGQRDWAPRGRPLLKIVRFTDRFMTDGVETHVIEQVPVKIFGVAKTVADCFRHRRNVGLTVALEGLQEALRQRKAKPGELAEHAMRGDVWSVMRPYLEALTANR